ncbi:hypothetical protein GGI42DRAFT_310981 [Trichoderma sp. SZMC 28013]
MGRLHAAVGQSINKNSKRFGNHPSNLFLFWICFISAATSGPPNKIECHRKWWIGLLRNVCKELNVVSEISFEV